MARVSSCREHCYSTLYWAPGVQHDKNHFVAIVDDDDAIRDAMASLVRSLAWPARTFHSGDALLQSGALDQVAFLISDVRMPVMTGIEMHDELLALGYVIPTVFVTAFPTPDLMAKSGTAGVLAILDKPIDTHPISGWLNQALGSP